MAMVFSSRYSQPAEAVLKEQESCVCQCTKLAVTRLRRFCEPYPLEQKCILGLQCFITFFLSHDYTLLLIFNISEKQNKMLTPQL